MSRPYKTFDTEPEALAFMHDQAKRIKNKGLAWRYGVYAAKIMHDRHGHVKPNSPWGVFLVDRKASG
jgi:hypothetical protein